jgi:hypothetical protein
MLHFMVQGCVAAHSYVALCKHRFVCAAMASIYRFIATPSISANGVKKYLYLTFHLVAATVHLCMSTVQR